MTDLWTWIDFHVEEHTMLPQQRCFLAPFTCVTVEVLNHSTAVTTEVCQKPTLQLSLIQIFTDVFIY